MILSVHHIRSIAIKMTLAKITIAILIGSSLPVMSDGTNTVVGHWRKTTIVLESPQDEHLVLNADATAENWTMTPAGQSAITTGTWRVEGKILSLLLAEKKEISVPFTFYQEQLVFPNIPNRRGFWDKIRR